MNNVGRTEMLSSPFRIQPVLSRCLLFVYLLSLSVSAEGFSVLQPTCSNQFWRHPAATTRQSTPLLLAEKPIDASSSSSSQDTNSRPLPRGSAPNRKTALKWVVQSIERLAEDPKFCMEKPSPQVLDALHRLERARTQGQVAEVGRLLESLDIGKTESVQVQERVIKALSISGLLSLALDLLDGFIEKGVMPSDIAYVAVCNGLRKAGRIQRLEQLLYQLGRIATEEDSVSVMALNTFLAALCKKNEDRATLEHARDWLRPGVSRERLGGGTDPDASSYSTVLHAAASIGNRRMVEELWEELTNVRKLKPTIYAYNALLRSVRNGPNGSTRVLDLLDLLLKEVQPDRYTIDMVLVPLIRAKRVGDVEALLASFVESRSVNGRTASSAFAAFLNTLIKAGELPTARAIFDTYLLPSLSSSTHSETDIRPTSRHFNMLIDAYSHACKTSRDTTADIDELQEEALVGSDTLDPKVDRANEARDSGRDLYSMMLEAGIGPDTYTLTSVLGLAATSAEATTFFEQAVHQFDVEVTPAVARALITTYGYLGDPASACIAFDQFASDTMNARTWNALLSALAKNVMLDGSTLIHVDISTPAYILADFSEENVTERGICKLVNGLSCCDAIRRIVVLMENKGDEDAGIPLAPAPNSQTFCINAAALQTGPSNSALAMELFRNATRFSFSADGRLINAVFRCFGDDIDGALSAWKNEIRRFCLAHEDRRRSSPPSARRKKGKNLIASYQGLLYVCGRALRPDIAVRLVYAMNKEELAPDEMALNCYRSGKRTRQKLAKLSDSVEEKSGIGLAMSKQFESILLVECTKYDVNDKRKAGEKRVRIIM